MVSGEPGSGRSRWVAEAAGDAPTVTLDAAATIAGSERDWAEQFAELAADPERVVVVDDAHLLGERLCTLVGRSLDDRAAARIWLVTSPTADLPPHVAALVARCSERLETTPLRERLHELPALVAALSTAQGAERPLVLTARALAALSEHPWPGNLVELAVLVQELSADHVVGPVDLPALPPRYRPGGRVLAGREHAERVAIVGALQSAEGNKSLAAARLGISRTTLYNRLRALAISEQQYVSNS
ncbi:hypothetical protein GCM10023175_02110 [Pseudonocardia xishanensis]|uniref:Sigma-54 factor interaction domain-containing protein n=1 Tax=Pseudonocardia xishanensis TaxID=630995 RepID=A0ABP8RDI5_9PSEU